MYYNVHLSKQRVSNRQLNSWIKPGSLHLHLHVYSVQSIVEHPFICIGNFYFVVCCLYLRTILHINVQYYTYIYIPYCM